MRLVKARHFDANADVVLSAPVGVVDTTYVVPLVDAPCIQLPRCQLASSLLNIEAKWYIDIAIEPGGVVECFHRQIVARCADELRRVWPSASVAPHMDASGGVVHRDVTLGIDVLRIRCRDDRDVLFRGRAAMTLRSLERGMHMVCAVRVCEVLVVGVVATYNIEICAADVVREDRTITSAMAQAMRRQAEKK